MDEWEPLKCRQYMYVKQIFFFAVTDDHGNLISDYHSIMVGKVSGSLEHRGLGFSMRFKWGWGGKGRGEGVTNR